jgi:two-component system chemotaxis response regulator CheB
VIVQHVDSEFSVGLAEWLQEATGLRVGLAKTGSAPRDGEVLLATSEEHLVMTAAGTLAYSAEPKHAAYRPSIDVLFHSLAEHCTAPATAVLLTGMGRDGALGLKSLRDAGWHTIAQDEASSIVFGMPKAAIELGAAERVVPLDSMAAAIASACG